MLLLLWLMLLFNLSVAKLLGNRPLLGNWKNRPICRCAAIPPTQPINKKRKYAFRPLGRYSQQKTGLRAIQRSREKSAEDAALAPALPALLKQRGINLYDHHFLRVLRTSAALLVSTAAQYREIMPNAYAPDARGASAWKIATMACFGRCVFTFYICRVAYHPPAARQMQWLGRSHQVVLNARDDPTYRQPQILE